MQAPRSLILASILLASQVVEAQQPTKGARYVLAVPYEALSLEKTNMWGVSTFNASIAPAADGSLLVNGSSTWIGAGAPVLTPLTLRKDKVDKKTGQRTLVLYSQGAFITLSLDDAAVPAAAVNSLLLPANETTQISEYAKRVYTALSERLFPAELKSSPLDLRVKYLSDRPGAALPKIEIVTYKEKKYLSFGLGTGTAVYNTLQLNQAQRVARVISQELLPELKRAEPLLAALSDGVHGANILFQIPWKNFLKEYERGHDALELYVPSDQLRLFMNADITSQAMVNASTIIVDGNRIEVTLSQQ